MPSMHKYLVSTGIKDTQKFWQMRLPLKINIFMYYLNKVIVLTKDNLTNNHLFFSCHYDKFLWCVVYIVFGIPHHQVWMISFTIGLSKWGISQIYTYWRACISILGNMVKLKWGGFWKMPTKIFFACTIKSNTLAPVLGQVIVKWKRSGQGMAMDWVRIGWSVWVPIPKTQT